MAQGGSERFTCQPQVLLTCSPQLEVKVVSHVNAKMCMRLADNFVAGYGTRGGLKGVTLKGGLEKQEMGNGEMRKGKWKRESMSIDTT